VLLRVGDKRRAFFGLPHVSALLVGPALFWLWGAQLFAGVAPVPTRSKIGLVVLTTLTPIYFFLNWDFAAGYRGIGYLAGLAGENALSLVSIWIFFIRAARHPEITRSLIFHWLVVAWLVSVAFPDILEAI
jgi:hypothetical protein